MWNPMQETLNQASAQSAQMYPQTEQQRAAAIELERFKRMQAMLARMQTQNVAPVNPSMMAPSQASPTSRPRLPRQSQYGGGGAGPLQVDETGAPDQTKGPRITPEGVVLPPITAPAAPAKPPVATPAQPPAPTPPPAQRPAIPAARDADMGLRPIPQAQRDASKMDAQGAPSAAQLDKLKKAKWDQQVITKAKENVAQPEKAKGFIDQVGSWIEQVGSVFDVRTKGMDPQAINPEYGVPNGMVWQAQRAALFNAGVTLMAAGMPNTPQNRAAILSQLGPALSGVSKDIYNMAQAKLMSEGRGGGAEYEQGEDEYGIYQINRENNKKEYLVKKSGEVNPEADIDLETAYTLWRNPKGNQDKTEATAMVRNVEMIDAYNEAETLLAFQIYAGKTGPMREWAVGYLRQMGLATDEQIAKAARSERYRQTLGDLVLNKMQALGGSDSNEELTKLTEMVGANTATSPEALLETIRRGKAKEMKGMERRQKMYDGIADSLSGRQREAFLRMNPLPEQAYTPPSQGGQQQEVVNPSDIKDGEERIVDGVRVKRMKGKLYYFDNGKWSPLED